MPQTYDVVAVSLSTLKVRVIASDKTRENARAVVKLAVTKRGIDEEFFAEIPHGTYRDGDEWGTE